MHVEESVDEGLVELEREGEKAAAIVYTGTPAGEPGECLVQSKTYQKSFLIQTQCCQSHRN